MSTKSEQPAVAWAARATHYRWYVALVLLLMWSLGQFDKLGVSVLFVNKSFMAPLGLLHNPAETGLLMTAFLIAYGISIFFWGLVGSRLGLRRVMLVGLVGWALCLLWFTLASTAASAIWSRAVLGVAEGFLWPISNAITANWFPLQERARAQAVWINGVNIGPVLGFSLLGGLLTGPAWRVAFYLIIAVTVAALMPLIAVVVRDHPSEHRAVGKPELEWIASGALEHQKAVPGSERAHVTATLAGSLSNGNAWLVMLAYLGTTFLFWGISTWLPTFLASSHHFSTAAITHWTQFAWMLALVAMLAVAWGSDRNLKRAVFGLGSWGTSVLGLIIAAFSGSPTTGAIVIGIALAGANVATLIGQNLIHSVVVARGMATGSGWILGIANIVGAFTPVIIGWILALGHGSFVAPFLFLAAMGVLSLVCGTILALRGY
ncbi:MAG: MFS transporter [Firmicutes bacterium]|nr:MFS transporter [Bacillota bacterium]